jgi:hypothetical protein
MADVRTEARDWIRDHWNTDQTLGEWWQALAKEGWAFPHWPKGHG